MPSEGDCDDQDITVYPLALELCDGQYTMTVRTTITMPVVHLTMKAISTMMAMLTVMMTVQRGPEQ